MQSGSFVTPELRSRYSDMLFRTRINGHPAQFAQHPVRRCGS
ncbi:hypothetical protein [Nocardia cyriacigeorgica]